MDITTDPYAHDDLQRYLIKVMAGDIREMLEQAGLEGAALRQAVEQVTFGVATIVDGSRVMEVDGKPVVPFLTFGVVDADSEDEEVTALLSSGEPSSMHEYATSVVREIFGS